MKKLPGILEKLNENQRKAVINQANKSIVIAGPGSGKTSVVSARTIWLIEEKKVSPEKIMVLTFSKAAAKEMEDRTKKIGGTELKKVTFSTIHSFAYRLLTEFNGLQRNALLSEKQALELFTKAVATVSADIAKDKEAVLQLMNETGYIKNTYGKAHSYKSEILASDKFTRVFEKYEVRKKNDGKIDFDDLLIEAEVLLRTNRFISQKLSDRYTEIIVDEFQDINPVQFNIIQTLSTEKGLMVVGDEDQSIYGFRGSVPDIMVNFKSIYPKSDKFFLETNYRVPEAIMERASQLISNNKKRFDKKIIPLKTGGTTPVTILCPDFQTEGAKIAEEIGKLRNEGHSLSEIAILYRNNSQGALIAESLANNNIPYQAPDGIYTVYDHWIWKDIYSYVKIASGLGNEKDLVQIINKPVRYIRKISIESAASMEGDFLTNLMNNSDLNISQIKNLEKLATDIGKLSKLKSPKEQLSFIRGMIGYDDYLKSFSEETGAKVENMIEVLEGIWEAAGEYETIEEFLQHAEEMKNKLTKLNHDGDRVFLMTMHRSKGLEFGTVFISGAIEGLSPALPREKGRAVNIDEERRLFYVAMTRAKEHLYISVPARRFGRSVEPSRFLAEIDGREVVSSGVSAGTMVFHKIFGEGKITDILETNGNQLLTIDFAGVSRKLDLEICRKNGYLSMINN